MARQYRSGNSNSRRSSTYGSGRSDGYERARQHIEDAQRLSRELGGTDVDVKKYFFSLPSNQLNVILTEYGEKFVKGAADSGFEIDGSAVTFSKNTAKNCAGGNVDIDPMAVVLDFENGFDVN